MLTADLTAPADLIGITTQSCGNSLVDASFAATFAGSALADVQLDPELHARALVQCLDALAIDGVYVNLCFSREQASRADLRDGRYRVLLSSTQ